MFLLAIDAHSKWLEVEIVPSLCAIKKSRSIFATHGIPEVITSDNGFGFTSSEFKEFVSLNGICHLTTAPYYPSSNGLAERAVQVLEEGLKKCTLGNIETRLTRVLFHYRTTPHSTTGTSPTELLMGPQMQSQLSLLRPNVVPRVQSNQDKQKMAYNRHAKYRSFSPGDPVNVRNFTSGPKWLSGSVIETQGSPMFTVQLQDGSTVHRHIDHICIRSDGSPTISTEDEDDPLSNPTFFSNANPPVPTISPRYIYIPFAFADPPQGSHTCMAQHLTKGGGNVVYFLC